MRVSRYESMNVEQDSKKYKVRRQQMGPSVGKMCIMIDIYAHINLIQ